MEANLPGALRLAAEILREPAFPDSEFETVRQQRIAAAEAGRSEPQALALTEFQPPPRPPIRAATRATSPTADEQIEDLKKVTLDDVRKFYQQFYGASVGEIAVVRDSSTLRRFPKLATELFGNWKSPGSYPRVTTMYQKTVPADQKIETPDKQNAFFVAGRTGQTQRRRSRLSGHGHGQLHVRRQRSRHAPLAPHPRQGRPELRRAFRFRRAHQRRWRQLRRLAISAPQNTPKVDASFRDELAKTLKEGFTADEVAAAKKAWLQERGMGRSRGSARWSDCSPPASVSTAP